VAAGPEVGAGASGLDAVAGVAGGGDLRSLSLAHHAAESQDRTWQQLRLTCAHFGLSMGQSCQVLRTVASLRLYRPSTDGPRVQVADRIVHAPVGRRTDDRGIRSAGGDDGGRREEGVDGGKIAEPHQFRPPPSNYAREGGERGRSDTLR
jgi:hypothetical protein